jgi:hypothetical protein
VRACASSKSRPKCGPTFLRKIEPRIAFLRAIRSLARILRRHKLSQPIKSQIHFILMKEKSNKKKRRITKRKKEKNSEFQSSAIHNVGKREKGKKGKREKGKKGKGKREKGEGGKKEER